MSETYERIQQTAAFLRDKGAAPESLIILGTGLGGLSERFDETTAVPYESIPNFPVSTAPGHAGNLVIATRHGRQSLVMEGRFHCYEGYSMEEVARPIRVAAALGAKRLFLTSAVGGMDPRYKLGEIVVVEDHINLMGDSPLSGPNDERIGPRFPDMSAPYDAELLDCAEAVAIESGFRLPRAVHVAVPGPQLETRAEYRMLRIFGADTVGMSTVPECIAAVHAGMRVAALAVVTDLGFPEALEPVDIEKIVAVANAAAPRLETLILGLLDHESHA